MKDGASSASGKRQLHSIQLCSVISSRSGTAPVRPVEYAD